MKISTRHKKKMFEKKYEHAFFCLLSGLHLQSLGDEDKADLIGMRFQNLPDLRILF
jgi:hypothetical protein